MYHTDTLSDAGDTHFVWPKFAVYMLSLKGGKRDRNDRGIRIVANYWDL